MRPDGHVSKVRWGALDASGRSWHPYGATRAADVGVTVSGHLGQFHADIRGFLDFFYRIGIEGLDDVARQWHGVSACGWWWPFHDFVILSDRPRTLSVDADMRLHADHGPAVAYPDGYAIHAQHGLFVKPGES